MRTPSPPRHCPANSTDIKETADPTRGQRFFCFNLSDTVQLQPVRLGANLGGNKNPFDELTPKIMAKRIPPLSDVQIRNAKPKATTYRLFDGEGLYLEVTPAGSKHWKFKYRRAERGETRISFGSYPEILLTEARQLRTEARGMLAHGEDPGEARKAAEEAKRKEASYTFEKIAKEWHTAKLRSWQTDG